jgi:hypothetical protein
MVPGLTDRYNATSWTVIQGVSMAIFFSVAV